MPPPMAGVRVPKKKGALKPARGGLPSGPLQRSISSPLLWDTVPGGGPPRRSSPSAPSGALKSAISHIRDSKAVQALKKVPGFCCRQAPLIISILLFAWSMLVFRRASLQHGAGGAGGARSMLGVECRSFAQGGGGGSMANWLTGGIGSAGGGLADLTKSRILLSRGGFGSKAPGGAGPGGIPSLTIFCAPKPYTGLPDDAQRRALLSWLHLSCAPAVVLLGDDPSFEALAREFPGRVAAEPRIDYNFYGVPLFHSMLARAQAADTDLSMIINGDIILLDDLVPAVQKAAAAFDNWLLTAARWDVGRPFPFTFEPSDAKTKEPGFQREVRAFVRRTGSLHTYGGVDFWMWNNSPVPLHAGMMPPFSFGRGKYDNWLTHEVVEAGLRHAVDASDAVTSVHVEHSYAHVAVEEGAGGAGAGGKSFWSTRKKSSWELYANIHLAQSHGSYTNQKGTALHIPWRMATCFEPAAGNTCLLRRVRPANCSCEYSPYAMGTQSDPKLEHAKFVCGTVSVDRQKDYAIDAVGGGGPRAVTGLPHTMEQLLPQLAKDVGGLKVVTLVAVTNGYADMLMNFVCGLRKLGLAHNLVVAALDEDLYRFAFTQGLAVYYERVADGLKSINAKDCAYGSQCFRQFTKLKSRAVLRVLKAGYSVLWTDVDIVWYSDPLPQLLSYGPGTFPVQSNEPNASLPGTGIRRINSGFYFARADAQTVAAFEAITAHAATTKLSEQPSFYDVLCGVKGELRHRDKRKEECRWTNGLRTIFLPPALYPNGAVHGFWNASDVTAACAAKGCIILHNNWIKGHDAKLGRMKDNGYWQYDPERRMCMHEWHGRLKRLTPAADVPRISDHFLDL